jgi:hypothetical protein
MAVVTAAAVLKKHLTQEWTRKQALHDFDDALKRAEDLPPDDVSTGRIFLNVGFKAWLAYFLATNYARTNFKGKAAYLRTVAAFEKLTDETRANVAIELLNTQAHPTVEVQIRTLSKRRKSGKTCRNALYFVF